MKDYNNLKYACLFGGGAIRGAAHAGVVKAFERLGIEPMLLAGSSVGSLVAALCAVGYNAHELSEVFLILNCSEIFHWGLIINLHLVKVMFS